MYTMKFRHVIYAVTGTPVVLILVWFFAIPENVIKDKAESIMAESGNQDLSIDISRLRKGIFFSLHADSILLKSGGKDAVTVTDFHARFAPKYLAEGRLAFILKGEIAGGHLEGIIRLPAEGRIELNGVALDAIPYIKRYITDIEGHVSSDIYIKDDSVKTEFKIPDLKIQDAALTIIPLINTFRRMQGALTVKGADITIDSLSLEGEKGYARLKGHITNGIMDLLLELMPATDHLNAMESMLIGKYIVSPGYYVVPIKRAVPRQ